LSLLKLYGANMTGALVRKADFDWATSYGFTAAQLYTTASYQAHDLRGTQWWGESLVDWNFAGQDLQNTKFALGDPYNAAMHSADLAGADTRGSDLSDLQLLTAITPNLIRPDGHLFNLDLKTGQALLVQNYMDSSDNPTAFPIRIDQQFAMSAGGVLQTEFDADDWGSTIEFASGIPVSLSGGSLDLEFADGTDVAAQVGRAFHLFDWTGVTPTGAFNVTSPYTWDLSQLYTTGNVTLLAVPEPSAFSLCALASVLCFFIPHRRG
jgi:hypothetical protein